MVYNWFTVLKNEMDVTVIVYVTLPNHVQDILPFSKQSFDFNNIIPKGKRFMAYKIINRLKKSGDTALLDKLSNLLTKR